MVKIEQIVHIKQGGPDMSTVNFEEIKTNFINADLDEKIRIYTTTEGLSVEQFRELLKYYPIQYLSKLEKALG